MPSERCTEYGLLTDMHAWWLAVQRYFSAKSPGSNTLRWSLQMVSLYNCVNSEWFACRIFKGRLNNSMAEEGFATRMFRRLSRGSFTMGELSSEQPTESKPSDGQKEDLSAHSDWEAWTSPQVAIVHTILVICCRNYPQSHFGKLWFC